MALNITLLPADVGTLKRIATSSAPDAGEVKLIVGGLAAGFKVGDAIDITYIGLPAKVYFSPVPGIILNTPSTLTFKGVFSTVRLVCTSTNAWDLSGDLKPTREFLTPDIPIKPAPLTMYTFDDATFGGVTPFVTDLGFSLIHNWHFRCATTSTITFNIPPDSAWAGTDNYYDNNYFPQTSPSPMPIGGSFVVGKHGPGDVVFAAGPGVTINTPSSLTINKLHGKVTLMKVGPDMWDIEGNLASA